VNDVEKLALREKLRSRVPGQPERPEKPRTDAREDCEKCAGWGWYLSEQTGTWWICPCTIQPGPPPKPDYARLGLREDELDLRWDAVHKGTSDGPKAVKAVRAAYERGWGMVFLWGAFGQAKTLVGKILTATALRDGKRSAYANVATVLDDIRLAFDEREHKTTELLRRIDWWSGRDVLFLDELDKINGTDWAQERLFQLLDRCYTRAVREQALTVIASNRSDGELDGYLGSRLRDRRLGPVVHLNGPDGRRVVPDHWKF
jgi:hypothetical protein